MFLPDMEIVYFLELLKAALFDLPPRLSNDANWEKILVSANDQCIIPLILPYVPNEYKSVWREFSFQNQAHYIQLLYEQNSLVNLLNNSNIQFVILKGTAAAIYYNKPSLRTFGDIDFYVTKEYFELTRELLRKNGYIYISNNDRQFVYEKNGINFELHIRISRQGVYDIDQIITNYINDAISCKIDNCVFPCLPKYANGLVLLWHIMHHLKGTGIGLRQIIDWMMFVYKELDDSTWEMHFKSLANEVGLEKLAITVTYMCKKWIGLPNDITWCDTADDYLADQLLARILSDGNFGHERAPFENVVKTMKKEGFFHFLQRMGISNWSLAQKHKLFRPFAWLYQLCIFLSKGVSGIFNGNKVFRKERHILSLEELWRRLE